MGMTAKPEHFFFYLTWFHPRFQKKKKKHLLLSGHRFFMPFHTHNHPLPVNQSHIRIDLWGMFSWRQKLYTMMTRELVEVNTIIGRDTIVFVICTVHAHNKATMLCDPQQHYLCWVQEMRMLQFQRTKQKPEFLSLSGSSDKKVQVYLFT